MWLARRALASSIDILFLLTVAIIVGVSVTGGGLVAIRGIPVSVTRTGNPVIVASLLAIVRYVWFGDIRFLLTQCTPRDCDRVATAFAHGFETPIRFNRSAIGLAFILTCSFVVRAYNAWAHPGFTTGDDVEIHEMTVGTLLGVNWEVWNVRSALYPMTFIYPAQAAALSFVGEDVHALVFAGRVVVTVLATLTPWLVYRITLHLSDNVSTALLAATFVACSRLHFWFASSELPRPIATVFILGAFWLLLQPKLWHVIVAGSLLGFGGSLRFGEFVFFAPAILMLLLQRRFRHAVLFGLSGLAFAALVLGAADSLYWHRPYFSLRNIIDYTLVHRASSRGFQPPLYYIVSVADWTNVILLALGSAMMWLRDKRVALWTWTPIVLLSLLPHKEARYVIAVHPFLSIGAALVLRQIFTNPARRLMSYGFDKTAVHVALTFAVLVALVFEASSWRARRTDDAVELARRLATFNPRGVAAQYQWRFGGRLYWKDVRGPVLALPDTPTAEAVGSTAAEALVLAREYADGEVGIGLAARGYTAQPALSTVRYVTFVRSQ